MKKSKKIPRTNNVEYDDYMAKVREDGKPDRYYLDHKSKMSDCDTRQKAAALLEIYQKQKRIKKCANLVDHSDRFSFNNSYRTFPIACRLESLDWKVFHKTSYSERSLLFGCPKSCQLYKSARLEESEKFCAELFGKWSRLIKAFGSWFASLHWVTQSILIITVLYSVKLYDLIIVLFNLLSTLHGG